MSIEYSLAIPFDKKDEMKTRYGIKWNTEYKMWCAKNERDYNGLAKYHVVKVDVLYQNKEQFKLLGGQWNGKFNYVHKGLYNKHREELDSLCVENDQPEYSDEDS